MTKAQPRNIGVPVKQVPKEGSSSDKSCPYFGNLPVRGRQFVGTVVSSKVPRMVSVEWERRLYIPKFERYAKKRSKVHAHNPIGVDAKLGDKVRIMACRPISKTKHFVVLEVIGREELIQDILGGREHAGKKKKEEVPVDAPKEAEQE